MAYKTNLNPGMNQTQEEKDRAGFRIDVEMTTGGKSIPCDELPAGPEVGNPYDSDELGEEYGAVTYNGGEKVNKGANKR